MYNNGYTIRQIAKEMNMSYGKVRNILIKEGVKMRNKIPKEVVDKIIELAKKGYSARKISIELKMNETTVLRILKERNLGKRIRKMSKEEIEQIVNMYHEGKSIYEIAKKLKRSTNLVVYYLKKQNIIRESSSTSP